MEIRVANKNDNKKEIAELIYDTDKYIYPYWFKSVENSIKTLSEMIDGETIYSYDKCLVAIKDNKIIGLLVFATKENIKNNDYRKWINQSFESSHVIKNYIISTEKEIKDNMACAICVCVNKAYRRQGIGSELFRAFAKMFKSYTLQLDVLQINTPALGLYKSMGLKVEKEYYGYNGYRMRKPLCYSMIKSPKKG